MSAGMPGQISSRTKRKLKLAQSSGKTGGVGDEADERIDGEMQVTADVHRAGDEVDSNSDEEDLSSSIGHDVD